MFGLMIGPLNTIILPWAPFSLTWWVAGNTYIPWYWGYFAIFGMIMASFTRAKAESVGGMKSGTVGIAERQEKLILQIWMDFLSGIPFLLNFFVALEITNILTFCIVLVGVLSHITVVQRLMYAHKVIMASEKGDNSSV